MSTERLNFSERLRQTLRNAGYPPDSPTQLARNFNIRYTGRPITVHAARKWLVGEAVPTQEKLRTLAHWLAVSAEWLRFGTNQTTSMTEAGRPLSIQAEAKDLAILENLMQLDEQHRQIVHQIVRVLIEESARSKVKSSNANTGNINAPILPPSTV